MYGDNFKFVEPRDVKVLGQTMRSEKRDSDIVDQILRTACAAWKLESNCNSDILLWERALGIAEACGVKLQWVDPIDDDDVPDFEEENEE